MTWAIENKGCSQRRAVGSSAWNRGFTATVRRDQMMPVCESGCGNWRPSADASAGRRDTHELTRFVDA